MKTPRTVFGVATILVAGGLIGAGRLHHITWANTTNDQGQTILPNGWAVTPAGRHIALPGDMPLAMTFVEGGSKLVVATGGFHDQGLTMIDVASETLVAKVQLGNTWAGLASSGNDLYVSGGPSAVRTVSLTGDGFARGADLAKPTKGSWTSGVAARDGVVYIADENKSTLTRRTPDGQETTQPEPGHPYGVAISPDGSTLAVSDWNAEQVTLHDPATLALKTTVRTGSHPSALAYAPDGRLFVTCSGSNTVVTIKDGAAKETIRTSLAVNDPIGSTPDALATSPDGKTLYVANADNNDVAVVDISGSESRVKGFIPTGWYPSSLAVSPDGKKLFIGTGKGLKFGPNGFVKNDKPTFTYINSLLAGTVSVVDVPDQDTLVKYTAQAESNAPQPMTAKRLPAEDAQVLKALKQIKHVLFVIRENRTYDQVFGDMGKGNGDPSLTMFGQNVTPNAHAMANQFVLLDNTYCNGEVSEDGHQWCNGAYCDDFVERAYVNSYSGRGEPESDGLADSPAGYMWDNCRKHGKTYRSYGEYSSFKSTPDAPPVFTGTKGLEGHASEAWSAEKKGGRDYERVQEFIDELNQSEKSGDWYNYMVMSLGEDHTSGLKAGSFTPFASVGSNDLGLGRMVEAISHSRFWKDSAIFVIEDDAQNGPDHVDAHRTAALVISPYIKHGTIDSTMYSTSSLVKTMELILGLPPMTQYDQRATPMFASFTPKPDLTPFTCVDAQVDLQARNPGDGALERASAQLDWSHYDAADPDKLNAILWQAIKGNQPMPAPVRSGAMAQLR